MLFVEHNFGLLLTSEDIAELTSFDRYTYVCST